MNNTTELYQVMQGHEGVMLILRTASAGLLQDRGGVRCLLMTVCDA